MRAQTPDPHAPAQSALISRAARSPPPPASRRRAGRRPGRSGGGQRDRLISILGLPDEFERASALTTAESSIRITGSSSAINTRFTCVTIARDAPTKGRSPRRVERREVTGARFPSRPPAPSARVLGSPVVAPLWVAYKANLGTLLRTCDAVGASWPCRRPTHYREALDQGDTLRQRALHPLVLDAVRSAGRANSASTGWRIVAVELAEGAVALPRLDVARERTIVLLGDEAYGVPGGVRREADACVEIPMVGQRQGLNVAVAAAGCGCAHWIWPAERVWVVADRPQGGQRRARGVRGRGRPDPRPRGRLQLLGVGAAGARAGWDGARVDTAHPRQVAARPVPGSIFMDR